MISHVSDSGVFILQIARASKRQPLFVGDSEGRSAEGTFTWALGALSAPPWAPPGPPRAITFEEMPCVESC